MTRWQSALALCLALACSACVSLSPARRAQAAQVAQQAQSTVIDCDGPDACATPSSLLDLGKRANADSTDARPRHYALILDWGRDALVARLSLIRAATRSIDLQTYIFDEDDAGHLVLEELLAAARRGVKVRMLVDQLAALKHVDTFAALAGAHANFEIRLYNPVLNRARITYPEYVIAAACCWRRLNQRMHSKLLLVDDLVGVTGGRNYQDDYYDWGETYNFRDRDILVGGPVARLMASNFEAFWVSPRTRHVAQLSDIGTRLLRKGVPPLELAPYKVPARVEEAGIDASDAAVIDVRLTSRALPVGKVSFFADLPRKHRKDNTAVAPSSSGLRELVESVQDELIIQTPYLVLSDAAQDLMRQLQAREHKPTVLISTNSLAATDSFITYALSYKYKRRYLRDLGFQIHEFKPFPADVPMEVEPMLVDVPDGGSAGAPGTASATTPEGIPATGAAGPVSVDASAGSTRRAQRQSRGAKPRPLEREYTALRYSGFGSNRPVALERAGMRVGLHAKSMVIDERVGVIGTHNFDPRGERFNTESAVVVEDAAFARELADSIRRDILPANAWTIARRDKPPILPGVEYSLAKVSEALPLFDLWPTRYATSYEFQPGPECPAPLPPRDPGFRACYEPVGDFPEVRPGFKPILTRIFTAFGAGLAPIL